MQSSDLECTMVCLCVFYLSCLIKRIVARWRMADGGWPLSDLPVQRFKSGLFPPTGYKDLSSAFLFSLIYLPLNIPQHWATIYQNICMSYSYQHVHKVSHLKNYSVFIIKYHRTVCLFFLIRVTITEQRHSDVQPNFSGVLSTVSVSRHAFKTWDASSASADFCELSVASVKRGRTAEGRASNDFG